MTVDSRQETGPGPSADGLRFIEWWMAGRNGREAPFREDLRIEQISGLLPRVTVLDVIDRDRFMFRLTGTDIDALAGTNTTGLNILDFTAPADRELRSRRILDYLDHGCGGVFWFTSPYNDQRDLVAQGISLPVRPAAGGPLQIWTHFASLREFTMRDDMWLDLKQVMPALFCYLDIGSGAPQDETGGSVGLEQFLARPFQGASDPKEA